MLCLRSTRLRVIVALTLVLATASTAQAAKQLRWKFKEGEKLPYALAQRANILIDANGIEIDIKIRQSMDVTWTVKSVASDGTAEISQKVDRVQLKMSTPFTGEVGYDSQKPDEKPGPEIWDRLGKPIEAMLGGEFTIKITPTGKVTELVMPESLLEALKSQGGGGGQGMMMSGGMFTESTIRQTIEQAVTLLPEEAAKEGTVWERELENKTPIGTQKIAVTYSYGGSEQKDGKTLEKINAKNELTFVPNEDSEVDIEMEISEQEGTGEIFFDAEAGKTINAKNKQTLTMEGDFMGNEFAQEIEMTLLLAQGTSDNLPPEEEASEDKDDDKDDKKDGDEKKDSDDKDDK